MPQSPRLRDYCPALHVICLALPLMLCLGSVHASSRRSLLNSTANLGVDVATTPRGLFVFQVTSGAPIADLRVADLITAVNGRRVETPAALLNRLAATGNSGTLTIIRNGQREIVRAGTAAAPQVNSPTAGRRVVPPGGGFINPSQMVITSQGVMHKAAAARLGLAGTPFGGAAESSGGVPSGRPSLPGAGSNAGSPSTSRPVLGTSGGFINPSQMVITSQGVMHKAAAARLGLSGTPFGGAPESSGGVPSGGTSFPGAGSSAGSPSSAPPVPTSSGFLNPSQMVITSQGVMHKDAAARLGLSGTPFSGAPESSGGVPAGGGFPLPGASTFRR
jgi:PDZ domain